MTHGITLDGYCARWASGLVVEPLGTWDSTGQEQLVIESASDEWQGTLTATFWGPSQETGTDMLMTDGACIVPPEALAAPGNGTITLRCTNAAGRRISVDLAYHSAGHAQVPGSPSEPTPDLWQQYVEQVQADADRSEQASKDAAVSADAAAKSAEAAAESAKQAAQATADIGEAKDAALQAIQQAQDTGVQAVQTATTNGVQAIQQAHQAAIGDIATDRQQALTDIETEGEKQTSAITSGGAAALEAIGQVEQTAIGQVQQAGTTQVSAVQQAGQAQQTAIEQAGQSWQQQITAAGTAELGRWAPAIWDTAPLAAAHDIYAAEGAPLRVTQQGKTEQGADPAPDNPQAIKGTGLGKSLTLDPDHKTSAWSFGPNALQTQPVLKIQQSGIPFGQQDGIFCNQYMDSTTVPMMDKSIFTASTYFGDYITIRDSSWASLEDVEADLRARIAAGNPCIVYWRADDGTDYTVGISTEDDAGGYYGQALAIGSPLYGRSSVADTVANDVLVDGEHKTVVTRRWRMVELDGTEAWNKLSEVDNGYQMPLTGGVDNLLCTHLIHNTTTADGTIYLNTAGWLHVYGPWATVSDLTAWLAAQKSAGTPVRVLYQLATPEEYASDPHTLPALGSLPETVKATGQSTVSYSADTKSYIDAKFAALSAAMLGG